MSTADVGYYFNTKTVVAKVTRPMRCRDRQRSAARDKMIRGARGREAEAGIEILIVLNPFP